MVFFGHCQFIRRVHGRFCQYIYLKYTMHRWYFAFDSIELAVKTTLVRCSPISGRMPLELRLMMPLMNRFPLFLFLHIIRYTD